MNPRYCLLAACMMHMEGYYSIESRAFRNKNPGNIENPPQAQATEGTFIVFPTALRGYCALVNDIAANAGKQLHVFIAKYAPPNENNTSEYLEVVCSLSGMTQDEYCELPAPRSRSRLHDCGPVPCRVISAGRDGAEW